MKTSKNLRKIAGLVRLRDRARLLGSAMLSADPDIVKNLPISLACLFVLVEHVDVAISEQINASVDQSELPLLSGGGGD